RTTGAVANRSVVLRSAAPPGSLPEARWYSVAYTTSGEDREISSPVSRWGGVYSGAGSNVTPPSREATILLPLMVTTMASTYARSLGLGKTSVTVAPATAPPELGQV